MSKTATQRSVTVYTTASQTDLRLSLRVKALGEIGQAVSSTLDLESATINGGIVSVAGLLNSTGISFITGAANGLNR